LRFEKQPKLTVLLILFFFFEPVISLRF
jgi:hypothetical protein